MDYEQIVRSVDGNVVVLTLNRPERLNAWTYRMSAELMDALTQADDDPSVGAVVVTGAGRAFCAGADIEDVFASRNTDDAPRQDWVLLVRSVKPVVAAVNGPAVGVGLTMVLPFDRIVVAADAKLSLRFVKMGLVPELASSMFLPQRCGWGAASDLMLSGRTVLGDEAVALGLADEVADDVLAAAVDRAREYAENPAPQLRWIKQLLTDNACETDTSAVQRRELARLQEAYASTEHKEAVAAFLARRR